MTIISIFLTLLAFILLGLGVRIAMMDPHKWNNARRSLKNKNRTHELDKQLARDLEQWRDSLD